MAKIVDPDQLNLGTEVVIDTTGSPKTLQLVATGNLDNNSPSASSGVTGQALYSFLKEEWLSNTSLNKHRFFIKAFTKFEQLWQNDAEPLDLLTRQLLRDVGWEESVGILAGDLYACFISLGTFDNVADQAYYQQVAGFDQSTTDFDKSGELNEAVLIFDADGTDYTDFMKPFLREEAKLYSSYDLITEQGLSSLEATVYRFPLSNGTDLNVNETDTNIDGNAPYTGMDAFYLAGSGFTTYATATVYAAEAVVLDSATGRWFFTNLGGTSSGANVGADVGVTDWIAYEGERQIGASWYAFNRIITGNGGTRFEVYEWGQRQLRQTVDINTGAITDPDQDTFGTVNGNVAEDLASFRGSDYISQAGVYVDGFDVNSQNNMEFNDITVDGGGLDANGVPITSTPRTFPFVAAGNLNFSQNLVDEPDVDTLYRMYFDTNVGGDFDTDSAIVVNDNGGSPIQGQITSGVVSFDFDYDNNVQGGRTSGADASVVVVFQGLNGAEWSEASFTITRATGLNVACNSGDERNYSNP